MVARFLTLCLLLCACGQAHAQRTLRYEPICKSCQIGIEPVAVLGDEDRGGVGNNFAIARDGRGRFLVSYPEAGDELLIFGAVGSYQKTFGRRGSQPGEVYWMDQITVEGEEIHLFDTIARRCTVRLASYRKEGFQCPLVA